MPNKLRPGRIADPIHGYVNFTGIERVIIEHRVSQRLRYISQTGLLHLVYPEARTSRFSHSLGAMHLASSFLAACVRNADIETQKILGEALSKAISKIAGETVPIEIPAKQLQDQPLLAHHYCPEHYKYAFLIAEQSLRLAALFHDLGHLPFSHDFETALEEYWRSLSGTQKSESPIKHLLERPIEEHHTKIHEHLGREISLLLFRDLHGELGEGPEAEVARISSIFARRILTSRPPDSDNTEEHATHWLHSLVDGEIDVDRCDYLLRDGHNLGFKFADYDLNRLVDNLVVVQDNESFELAIKPQGIGPVESFLISRFRSSQYSIRHHKVSQIGAALVDSISHILANPRDSSIEEFLADLGALSRAERISEAAERESLLRRFASYDDMWWMSVMRREAERSPNGWLKLVCWRKSGPTSLWKWRGKFPAPLRRWNTELANRSDDQSFEEKWREAVSSLRRDEILIVRHRFSPWEASRRDSGTDDLLQQESQLKVLTFEEGRATLEPISLLSPMIRALRDAWMEDVQVQAFSLTSNVNREDVLNRLPIEIPQEEL